MGNFTGISLKQELGVLLFKILYLQLGADRLFVERRYNLDVLSGCRPTTY